MGVVYLADDLRLGRRLALKTMMLSEEFAGPALDDVRARFVREADAAGRLDHPDIVTIHDVGEVDGLAFIAMEFLPGEDVRANTRPGTLLPVLTVLRTLERVALALDHAHHHGVVHRDIKPANVMLDAATGSVKVTDFGIASVTDAHRTRTGMMLGTPAFMSPEQIAGRRVDGRSDLYSLGVMLHQLLTGYLPHRAESMAALLHEIANDPPPDVRALCPELPETLADVVTLALQKRPDMRYANGLQLATDLAAIARQLSGSAAEPAGSHAIDAGRGA